MTEHHQNGITYRTADSFTAAGGAVHAFTTRCGGVSTGVWSSMNLSSTRGDDPAHVRENYNRLCGALGVSAARVERTRQVHGTVIRTVRAGEVPADVCDSGIAECDGLITDVPGTVLAVFTADCIPVLLYDPVRRVIAAVHAGWRGTAGGIAGLAARKMQAEYGCRAEDILAAIGPGIGVCCFETGDDVPDAMRRACGGQADELIFPKENGKFTVDLKGLNRLVLMRAGVLPQHISVDSDCTRCHPEKYWSHRLTGPRRGNQGALIALV